MSRKNQPASKPAAVAAEKPVQAADTAPVAEKPATAPSATEKPSAPATYVCVLAIKENDFKGKAGDQYKGDGLKDPARLEHLLKRGAIKAGE